MAAKSRLPNPRETALFKVDQDKKKILSLAKHADTYLKLGLISVTSDQPIYWPDEDVFLKVLLPLEPLEKVVLTLQKKDATPKELGVFSLNEAGILVKQIATGRTKRLEVGEYRVEAKSEKSGLESYTTFSMVEGALGALSFAHEFVQISDPKELSQAKGAWFLGNAAGAGKRWGNGLNLKNEIRILNKPYNGKAVLKTRCYLPGCNGVEAGPAQETVIGEGRLEAVLDVSSHSGPFELEVITDAGSLRNLFEKSGHVERQNIPITAGMYHAFFATLAPYEGTTPIYGRDIYWFESKEQKEPEDAWELASPLADRDHNVTLKARKDLVNPRVFVMASDPGKGVKALEIKVPPRMAAGQEVTIPVDCPYSLVAAGAFSMDQDDFHEGWALVFTEAGLRVNVTAPDAGRPLGTVGMEIECTDRLSGRARSVSGVLEVFDNRVASKSGRGPLLSAVGDSFRTVSNALSSWQDWTGIQAAHEDVEDKGILHFMSRMVKGIAPPSSAPMMADVSPPPEPIGEAAGWEDREPRETIREGEKKVVFCGLVKTGQDGRARVDVTLPPQTGRCQVRFTAVDRFDAVDGSATIDVAKGTAAEVSLQPLLIPGAEVYAEARIVNNEGEPLQLSIYGAGLKARQTFEIAPGSREVEFEVQGEDYGSLFLELADAGGRILDKREIKIKDVASGPVTFSDVIVSDGSPIRIPAGRTAVFYANPARLLKGLIANVQTTLYSWFGHSEAVSASAAVEAVLLRAIHDDLVSDEGLRDTLKADLIKAVKDLRETFYDAGTKSFRPYPGLPGKDLWSVWAYRNLNTVIANLEGAKELKAEFASSLVQAGEMTRAVAMELKRRRVPVEEQGFVDPGKGGVEVLPVVINGQVVYRAVTDDTVIDWFVQKVLPGLDLPTCESLQDVNARFVKMYDTYRFLRAFERTGTLYYLLTNAQALFLKGDEDFFQLFNQIAKGLIATREPGLIQGPALLGGVYSAPQTLLRFLELLVAMAESGQFKPELQVTLKSATRAPEVIRLAAEPNGIEAAGEETILEAPAYVTVRLDFEKQIRLYDYLDKDERLFEVKPMPKTLVLGEEADLAIELAKDRDPSEYVAVIAAPSVVSVRQTEDLLSDYKGQLLYGQKAVGGARIQLLAVPFRGSRTLRLVVEAASRGTSPGYVLVRHISNPFIVTTRKIPPVAVVQK